MEKSTNHKEPLKPRKRKRTNYKWSMKGTKASRRRSETSVKASTKPKIKTPVVEEASMSKDYYKPLLPFISVRASTVPFDHDVWGYPDDENGFKGLGVFQQIVGSIPTIYFNVVGTDIVSVLKTDLHELQKAYQMDSLFDEDYVIVPTVKSIRTGNIPVAFRIQHSKRSPTHKMTYHLDPDGRDYPFSYPRIIPNELYRYLGSMTELTFDYNYRY